MRDIINAIIDEKHFLKCSTYSIARNGEGLTPCLSISIPDGLFNYWAYIDFKKPNGEKFKTPRIEVSEGKITYNIPSAVLDEDGELEVQIIFQNADGGIWKTYVKEFAVRYSINATDDIPDKEDFITEAQKVLDEAVETAKSVEERANNGEFNGKDGIDGKDGKDGENYVLTDADKQDISNYAKPKTTTFTDGATLIIENNTEYIADTDILSLTIVYPDTPFICSLNFTLASEGDIIITLPESKYIGGIPSFANGETWELNIKNGVVIGGLAE